MRRRDRRYSLLHAGDDPRNGKMASAWGADAAGEVFEFSDGYRAYPDLGVDNPTVQPFVRAEFLLIPFMANGDVDFLRLGVSFNASLDIWFGHNLAFEAQARFVGIGEDFFVDARFHHGYVAEAGVVLWL